jgi:membrane-bound lytic murein transglycosylase D
MKNKITIILVFLAFFTVGKVNAESYGGHYSWTEDHHILLSYISNNKESLLSYLINAYDKSKSYRNEIERVFMTEGVPTELIALAAIESNFSPNAVSHAGAVGMWQFMPETGEEIGLKINSRVDERRNWKKSTVAAARYLKHLAEDHFDNNYELAILAYNAGLGNVKRAIKKNKTTDPWILIQDNSSFYKESREYLPKVVSAIHIFNYIDERNKTQLAQKD